MMFYEDNGSNAEEAKEFMAKVLKDIEHFYYSVEGVLELAEFMSRFSNYSARNMQVIKSQFPDAYACANLNTFAKAGFSLKDGEKEMKIFHPRIKEFVRDPKSKKEVLVKDLTVEQKEQVKNGKLKVKKDITYYLKESALDISQTNATIADLKTIFPNRQFDFEVTEENKDMLLSGLRVVAEKEKMESNITKDDANSLEIEQIPKIMYEFIREKLQNKKGMENKEEVVVEFESQMATHVVCKHYGMDMSEHTVPYISKWIQNDQDFKEKDSSIINIHETARAFITSIDQEISELQRDTETEMQVRKPGVKRLKETVKSEKEQNQHKILKRIQEKAEQAVSENIGLSLGHHWSYVSQQAELTSKGRWEDYKINLSEDGKFIEDIQPNMILSMRELNTIVTRFGTEEEVENLEVITKEIKSHYEANLEEREFLNAHIAKVTVDQQKNMKVECISEYVKETHENFDFNHSVFTAIDSINHSIMEAHNEVLKEGINAEMVRVDNFEVVTDIQQKTSQEIHEKLGIDLEKHWEEYEIQLSEDNRVIEDISPEMRLSLKEMHGIVNKFGTKDEQQELEAITKQLGTYYESDLNSKEFYDVPILKVSVDRQQNMKVECLSEYVKDNHLNFDFNHSVSQTLNEINHSISMAHREVMDGDIEYKGLYPVDESEIVYCEVTGKPLQQNEEAFHIEGYGYVLTEELTPEALEDEQEAYYTSVEYENVEMKQLPPLQRQEEKQYQDAEIVYVSTPGIYSGSQKEEVYQVENIKSTEVKTNDAGATIQVEKTIPHVDQRYLGTEKDGSNDKKEEDKKREEARRRYVMQQMAGRDY